MDDVQERNEEIIKMRRDGKLIREIAKSFDINKNTVNKIVASEKFVSCRARKIGKYVYDYVRDHAASPSIREIAQNAIEGINLSTSNVSLHLKRLEELGLIELPNDMSARRISVPFAQVVLDDFETIMEEVLYSDEIEKDPV